MTNPILLHWILCWTRYLVPFGATDAALLVRVARSDLTAALVSALDKHGRELALLHQAQMVASVTRRARRVRQAIRAKVELDLAACLGAEEATREAVLAACSDVDLAEPESGERLVQRAA